MNKKGFTLIELLAVIIILGILMVIAVPAVTKYINESRKNTYVNSAKNIAGGARALVNSGGLDLSDEDTTYYIDSECIKLDSGSNKSPYGDFERAYVVVTADYNGHEYYWTSVDETGRGVKGIINVDKLDPDDIDEDISSQDITTDRGLDNRSKVVIVDSNCEKGVPVARTGTKISSLTGNEIEPVCKRATTLHTKTCERQCNTSYCGCGRSVGYGNPITYGTLVNGTSKAGDAYDCDVNNDKVYDSETERFYYVGSDGANSTLIYYINMNNPATHSYDSSGENWHGPRIGYQYLPDTSIWSNPGLIAPGTRQIVNENGGTTTIGGTIESFEYVGKAARFLTYQEVQTACGKTTITSEGNLDSCNFLMENLDLYENDNVRRSYRHWLETPNSGSIYHVWYVDGNSRVNYDITYGFDTGVRPVITVKTSDIE